VEGRQMAIYGIGANYEGKYDKRNDFFTNDCACVGWDVQEAPALHSILKKVKIGDIIYIKSMVISTKELLVRAVGIVTDDEIKTYSNLGEGVKVKWMWKGENRIPLTAPIYRYNVFNNTIYEEYNPAIQKEIVSLII
jgi:hypothetical protein